MQTTSLLYDAYAVPEWALRLLLVSIFACAFACSRALFARLRGRSAGLVTGGLAGIAGLGLLACGTVVALQQHGWRQAAPIAIEGGVDEVWAQAAPGAAGHADWHCEGFRVAGVRFTYVRGMADRPYFHNAGPQPIVMREGDRLRVHYVVEQRGGETRNRIVRLERLPQLNAPGVSGPPDL